MSTAAGVAASRPNRLGFFALAFGTLGLGFLCVPWAGVVLSAAGMVLGLLALVLRGRSGFTVPGTIMSAVALALNLTLPFVWPDKFPGLSIRDGARATEHGEPSR